MQSCDIIIPVWNQLEATNECVDSIVKHTDYPYRLILIDNGSSAETAGYLRGLKERKDLEAVLIRNDENLGFVKAVNQGIKASDGPYVCVMNNDTIATSGWLGEMVAVMEAKPEIGLLNPSSNTSGQFPYKNQSIDEYAAALRQFRGEIQELYTCRGFCMLIRRAVLDRLGLLDEIYHIGYFDDTDYCKRAQGANFRTARAKAAYVYHKENISFKDLENNKDLFKANEAIFFKRWGMPLRLGYFIDRVRSPERIDDIATDVARSGHQIIIFLKRGSPWPVRLDHFDIRKVELDPIFFGLVSIYKILKRKKKKKLHVLLTDNAFFGRFLKSINRLHSSGVIINATKEEVLELLKKASLSF